MRERDIKNQDSPCVSILKNQDSPCVSICRFNDDDVCIGCGRTVKEVHEAYELKYLNPGVPVAKRNNRGTRKLKWKKF